MKMVVYSIAACLGLAGCSVSSLIEAIRATEANVSITEGSSFDFLTVSTVATASEKEIHLQNSSSLALTGLSAQLTFSTLSAPSTPFAFKGGTYPGVGGTCGVSLQANSTCKVVLVYDPTHVQADSGTLTFNYSFQSLAATSQIALSGIGVTPAVLTISDANTFDFSSVALSSHSAAKTFTVTNSGGVALSMMEANLAIPFNYVGGAYPGTAGTCSTTLAALSTCTLVVEFTPIITGAASSSVVLSYNDGLTSRTADRPVIGTGYVPNVAPVATAQSVIAFGVDKSITLAGTDANGDALTFSIVAGPSHGSLAGTIPHLVYTPTPGYVGADSFTFNVNDGTVDSATAATVSIDNRVMTIFVRSGSNSPAGNDGTGAVGDPLHPYLTAQAALLTALAQSVAVKIDLGIGNFGDINITQEVGGDITWVGVSHAQSFVNTLTVTGANGVSTGGNGENAPNIVLKSDGTMKFLTINSTGGNGTDCTDTFYNGGPGGAGGNIELGTNVRADSILTTGGNGGYNPVGCSSYPNEYSPSGAGGNIVINSNAVVTGLVETRGGGGYTFGQGGAGGNIDVAAGATIYGAKSVGGSSKLLSGAGGNVTLAAGSFVEAGGVLAGPGTLLSPDPACVSGPSGTITSSATVAGSLDVRQVNGPCSNNQTSGSVTVNGGSVDGNIYADGGEDRSNSGGASGNAGSVTVAGGATVTGSIFARAGCGVGSTTGGNITMNGTSGPLDASTVSPCGYYGNHAGSIFVNGTVNGDVTAKGDDSTYYSPNQNGGNGGTVNVSASGNITGTIYAQGGNGSSWNGEGGLGGSVSVSGVAHAITTAGGSATSPACGGRGGSIAIYDGANVTSLVSSAGTGSGNFGCASGGKAYAGSISVGIASTEAILGVGADYFDGGGDGANLTYSCSSPTYGLFSININGGNGWGSGDGTTYSSACTP